MTAAIVWVAGDQMVYPWYNTGNLIVYWMWSPHGPSGVIRSTRLMTMEHNSTMGVRVRMQFLINWKRTQFHILHGSECNWHMSQLVVWAHVPISSVSTTLPWEYE